MPSLRILLVEDDLIERKSIQRAIGTSALNHSVTEVYSAEEALSLLSNVRFDVILMDYHLPGMSGIEAILQLADEMPMRYAPVLMVSNNQDHELAEKCIKAGAQDFVLKAEVTPDRICRAINQSCQRHAKEQKMMTNYEQVKALSERDRLTGLHNRHFFNKSLQQRLQNPELSKENMLAVMLMDLNKFKLINDTLGHEVGDQLLIAVTKRFTSVFRENELCARLGGDEFVFVAEGLSCAEEASHVAKRLCKTFLTPFLINNHEIYCGCSVGIALAPQHSRDPQTLLRFADMAMYQAKNNKDMNYCLFEPQRFTKLLDDQQKPFPLSSAMSAPDKNFELMYYPFINSQTNRVWGYHCKVHLRPAHFGHDQNITPTRLQTLAAQQNYIRALGFWQLRRAFAELRRWKSQVAINNGNDTNNGADNGADRSTDNATSASPVFITFEINAQQLTDPDFFAFVELALQKYKIEPTTVVFSIKEKVLSEADETIAECIERLSNTGVQLAVTNFGMGSSSLTMLLKYPIHLVELAPVVVHQATNDISPYRKLLAHIQEFMNNLDIAVAVSGITTENELALCKNLGFSLLQGSENMIAINASEAQSVLSRPYSMDTTLLPTLAEPIQH